MLNGKRYLKSEKSRAKIDKIANGYSSLRTRVDRWSGGTDRWILSHGKKRALTLPIMTVLLTFIAIAAALSLFMARSFTIADTLDNMHQINSIHEVKKVVQEEQREKNRRRSGAISDDQIIIPNLQSGTESDSLTGP